MQNQERLINGTLNVIETFAMHRVCIVVPIYKNNLSFFEKISLEQLFNVLSKYPIYYVKPKSLQISNTDYEYKANIEEFDDSFFKNTKSYSELLLSKEFYSRFEKYEYMLIYQLDAFVFSDRLMEFVEAGYDYIGAPLNNRHWREYHIGNGGLSLRKIDSMLRILTDKESVIGNHHRKRHFEDGEDNFWAYCALCNNVDFSVPSIEVSMDFSTQSNCFEGFERIKKRGVPFGTHHFPGWNYDFWREYIVKEGYKLPDISSVQYKSTVDGDNYYNSIDHSVEKVIKNIQEGYMNANDLGVNKHSSYSLWGAGEWGYIIYRILITMNIKIVDIYDSNPANSCIVTSMVIRPNIDRIKHLLIERGVKVIVTTHLASGEVEELLKQNGLEIDRDYFLIEKIKNMLGIDV